ncbi:Ribosomal RNA small subunit methyltransferase H [Candidatus Magnetomoraceae bacterium gMMP-15]
MSYHHISVMPKEVMQLLNCRKGKIYVDGTLGGSGHAKAILDAVLPDGILIGMDQDIDAIKNASQHLKPLAESQVMLFNENFIQLPDILSKLKIKAVDGILLDLGMSLHQLKKSKRGFSFKRDEPLDMRMDQRSEIKAQDLVNNLKAEELADIFYKYGEERYSWRIAKKIIKERQKNPVLSSQHLADIVIRAKPVKFSKRKRIHPATRVFMALRIAVNQELKNIEEFMENVVDYLNPRARLCVISFHSLEDRIVKHAIRKLEKGCTCPPDFPICVCGKKKFVRCLTRKPVRPSGAEINENPMARSALLRAMEKLED